jgi:FSR family fosmidomycin resistance protein-like MFS transporter
MSRDTAATSSSKTQYLVLWVLCFSHVFNDVFQSLIPAALPFLKEGRVLVSFTQVGLVVAIFQLSTSVGQPLVGLITDKRPQPYLLPMGMITTLLGTLLLAYAWSFPLVLVSVALFGMGAAVYHPESARLVYMASGSRPGFAQSLFQAGGNVGAAICPLLFAVTITPYGQKNIALFAILVLCATLWIMPISRWYSQRLKEGELLKKSTERPAVPAEPLDMLPTNTVLTAVFILMLLVFSKTLYTISFCNFLTFYMIERFGVNVQQSQLYLFAFLIATATGTMVGGPIGDRIGRKWVIWGSILGPAPFALWLPHMDSLWGTCLLSMLIGAIMASSFPAILIFAQELIPGKIGTVGGLFYGLSFGSAAIASALLGGIADMKGIVYVFSLCAYMPLMGLLTWFLPSTTRLKGQRNVPPLESHPPAQNG